MPKYQVVRSISIDTNPQRAYEVIADFRTWTTWSPWLLCEPEAKVTVSDDPSSIGSQYAWKGDVTGVGELEHKQLQPSSRIEDELRFIKPIKSTCKVVFDFRPEGTGTHVTWTMDGTMPWFLFWLIPMVKTFVGMDFQRGLTMLKEWIETGRIQSKTIVHGVEQCGPIRMAGIAGSCKVSEVGPAMDKAFSKAREQFASVGLPLTGQMISVYTKFRVKDQIFDFVSGYLLPSNVSIPSTSTLQFWDLPSCNAFRVEHIGSYRHLGNGWSVANQLVQHKKLKQRKKGTYEIYRTIPPATPEDQLQTDIYLPLRG